MLTKNLASIEESILEDAECQQLVSRSTLPVQGRHTVVLGTEAHTAVHS